MLTFFKFVVNILKQFKYIKFLKICIFQNINRKTNSSGIFQVFKNIYSSSEQLEWYWTLGDYHGVSSSIPRFSSFVRDL